MEIRNAKIKFSSLSLDDKLTFQIGFECGETKTFVTDKLIAYVEAIELLLKVLEIHSWEELPRKFARIKIDDGKIIAIGNLIENKWMNIEPLKKGE